MNSRNFPIEPNGISNLDYKRPIPPHHDMRTAYDFGHRLIYDNDVCNAGCKVGDTAHSMVLKRKPLYLEAKSETKDSFKQKYPDHVPRMTSTSINKMKYIKGFDESRLKFVPRPINEHLTTYNSNFTEKGTAPEATAVLKDLVMQSQLKKATYNAAPDKPNYSKYLDVMASSYTLDHYPFSKEQLNTLASKDAITFWSWNGNVQPNVIKEIHPAYISTFAKSKIIVPPRTAIKSRTIPSLTKSVPNKGLTTEYMSNYRPVDDTLKLEVDLGNHVNIIEQIRFTQPKTEYNIYGSGDKTQRYV